MARLRRGAAVAVLALLLMATFGLSIASPASSTHAVDAASTLTVTTTADTAPPCQASAFSLRCAITQANKDGSGDTITFTIPAKDPGCSGTPAVCTIAVTTALPTLTASATTINGYSQPGAHPNTHALSAGDNAVLTIVLDGTKLNFNDNGFTVTGSGDTIEGISIVSFALGIATTGTNTPGTTIAGNFLGITPTSTTSFGNGYGVSLGSGGVTVGGTTPAAVNVLSHNLNGGIFINNAGTTDVVEGNLIGTDATGTKALGNGANGVGVAASAPTSSLAARAALHAT